MQDKDHLKKLLERYRLGQAWGDERALIIRFLTRLDISVVDERAIAMVKGRSRSELRKKFAPQRRMVPVWLRVAAACLLVAAGAGLWLMYSRAPQEVQWQVVSTVKGELKRVVLPDSTRITLNNVSRLRYPVTFNGKRREVELSGEGFFEVRHDASRPFFVKTDRLRVQVLGTSFDVRSYPSDENALVGVISGKVGVSLNRVGSKSYLLIPGEHFVVGAGGVVRTGKTDVAGLIAWQDGRLVFRKQPLSVITRELERRYAVRFVFKEALLKQKLLTIAIPNEQLGTVLKVMEVSANFHYRLDGKTVTLW